MADQLSIANRALLAAGSRNYISSFNEGSVEANAVSLLWTPTFEALGRTARWACLRKQATLSLLAAAEGTPENVSGSTLPVPQAPWLYAYAYPSDCLSMQYIVPSYPGYSVGTPLTTINDNANSWLPTMDAQIPFAVSTSLDANNNPILIILTNQEQAQAVYTVNQQNPAIWDSMFQAAMVASLAAYLVPALNLSMPLMQLSIQNAERLITEARTADGNEGVTVMDHYPDWMAARLGGTGWGPTDFPVTYGNIPMVWPVYGTV
jgi:hypothetical protein